MATRRRGAAPTAVALATAVGVLAVVVGVWRQPGSALDNVWAEDGKVFLVDAWRLGLSDTLRRPYAGYLHLYPRTAAAIAGAVPVADAARALAVLGALPAAVTAVAVLVGSRDHLRSPWTRTVLALGVVVFPSAGFEVAANIANAHWFLTAAAFWMLVWTPRGAGGVAAAAAVVFTAADSDPLTGLLLPLAVVRVVAGGRGSRLVPGALLAGLAVQLPTVLSAPQRQAAGQPGPGTLLTAWSERVLAVAATGFDPVQSAPTVTVAAAGVGAVAVGALAVALSRRRTQTAVLLSVCVLWSVLTFVVPIGLRWSDALAGRAHPTLAVRYVLLPTILVWVIAAKAADALTERGRALGVLGVVAFAALLALVCLPTLTAGRPRPLDWRTDVAQARAACAAGAGEAAFSGTPFPAWGFRVPCALMSPGS